jgi:hypothetical protein
MIAFIDDHREAHGVEPICKVLPIAPSTYHAHALHRRDPERSSARARRDVAPREKIRRIFEGNFSVYGARKVWRQLIREGESVARCTIEWLLSGIGLQGAIKDDRQRQGSPLSARQGQPAIRSRYAKRAVGGGLHIRRHMAGLSLCRVCHRCLRKAHRRLARLSNRPCQLCARRARTGIA